MIHISRRGSIDINPTSSPIAPVSPATSHLEMSRTKLAELQRKSRSLSASLRRHEHVMTTLATDTAAVEAQAQRQVDRRISSPAWSRYGSSASVKGTSHASVLTPATTTTTTAIASHKATATATPIISPTVRIVDRHADAAYKHGFERQRDTMKREMTVSLARDLAEAKARCEELQHAAAMKDVQLRVCESEVTRLREGEQKFMEKITSLSGSVSDLKSHLDLAEDMTDKANRRGRSAELEFESVSETLSETRQVLTAEKVEREALALQVMSLNDERNSLHRELTALRNSEANILDEVRRERSDFYETQQSTRVELEEIQHEFHRTVRESSQFRASALSFRARAEEAETQLVSVQQVHKATIEQLVSTRERLKREQDARWNAESEAARLRGTLT